MREIIHHFEHLNFESGSEFVWSPRDKTVYYDTNRVDSDEGKLALLHEVGHAELKHSSIRSDMHLVGMEVEAWEFARQHAPKFKVEINEDYIDRCLESYRVWAYKRALCPNCNFHGIQKTRQDYHCFTCRHAWRVTTNLTLQPHRMNY